MIRRAVEPNKRFAPSSAKRYDRRRRAVSTRLRSSRPILSPRPSSKEKALTTCWGFFFGLGRELEPNKRFAPRPTKLADRPGREAIGPSSHPVQVQKKRPLQLVGAFFWAWEGIGTKNNVHKIAGRDSGSTSDASAPAAQRAGCPASNLFLLGFRTVICDKDKYSPHTGDN